MNDQIQILTDQIRSLLIVLAKTLPAVDWSELPPDCREMMDVAISEAREAIGEGDDCEAGACRL